MKVMGTTYGTNPFQYNSTV